MRAESFVSICVHLWLRKSVALGGFAEVIRRLVGAGFFFFELAEQIVEERAGAETVALVGEPRVAERLLHRDEKLQRLLRGADAAGGLHADGDAGIEVEIADG